MQDSENGHSTHELLSRDSKGVAYGMRVYTKKTKTMKVSKSNKGAFNITIEGQPVEQVKRIIKRE